MSPRVGLDPAAVVAAAAGIADVDGLAGLTLARLAAALGVRTPSLYAHIDGLDDLRDRLAERGAEQLAGALSAAAAGRAGRDGLEAIAWAYRRYAVEHPGLYAALQVASTSDAPRAAAEQAVQVVVAVLDAYRLPEAQVLHAVRAVRAALHGFTELERLGGFGLPLSVDESFAGLLEMLDAGLRAAAA